VTEIQYFGLTSFILDFHMDFQQMLAARLHGLREQQGWSLEQLAERSGVSRSNISNSSPRFSLMSPRSRSRPAAALKISRSGPIRNPVISAAI